MERNSQYASRSLILENAEPVQFDTMMSKSGVPRDQTFSMANSTKQAKSTDFFKTTRVDSCSHVILKNGVAQAIPFRPKPKQMDNSAYFNQSENQ